MPFIDVRISRKTTLEEREKFKTQLGKAISVIPNKSEGVLMIDIADGRTMYFRGKELKNGAYAKINLHMDAPHEAKAKFVEDAFKIFEDSFGFKKEDVFLTVVEFPNWGADGKYL